MKKEFLVKLLVLIFVLCSATCIFTACKDDGDSADANSECVHSWQEADCLTPKTCSKCGAVEGLALDHSWGEWFETEPATCQMEGEKRRNCERCGYYETRMIFVIDHNFVEGYCSMCGAFDENYHEHSWQEADCLNPKTCLECGAVEGEALGHLYKNSNLCSVCNYVSTEYFTFDLLDDTYSIKAKSVNNMPAEVVIPSSYNGKAVTEIGYRAFSDCSSLISVVIPDSVTSIGESAFANCESLQYNVKDKLNYLGNETNPYLYLSGVTSQDITSANIDSSCKFIGFEAFKDCSSLTSIVIPDSVTSIGYFAFSDCSSLTSVVIGDSVTSIGKHAFSSCSSLTSVVIGNSVTSIGYFAFKDCSSLTSVVIPDSVTSIGLYAFSNCSSLTSVVIPDSVISIGDGAFEYCSSLTSIVIPDSVTSIGGWAFYFCRSLNSVVIGNSVTSIGYKAFVYCSSLTSIVIPDSVTSIGNHAFYHCYNLTSIVIPDSVTSIGDEAFRGCSSLTSVVIPDSVTSIGLYAFSNCSSLTNIEVDENNVNYKSIDGNLYSKDGKTLIQYAIGKTKTSFVIPDSVTSIGNYAFAGCESLQYNVKESLKYLGNETNPYLYLSGVTSQDITFANIDNSCKFIGSSAFAFCYSLTSIVIPDSVTSIGDYAFYYCESLTSIVIPDSVTSIGSWAFEYCSSLTSIEIPDSVISIGEKAFHDCYSLTSVVIGDSVTSIGNYAFYNCTSLTSIKYRGTEEEWNSISKGYNWDYYTGNYTVTYNYMN